jgi:hypothetical protein
MLASHLINESVQGFKIELPDTDTQLIVTSKKDLFEFLYAYGDVKVEFDPLYRVYRVPAFAEGRAQYTAAKAAYCRKYGCN